MLSGSVSQFPSEFAFPPSLSRVSTDTEVSRDDSKRTMAFVNEGDFISFRSVPSPSLRISP